MCNTCTNVFSPLFLKMKLPAVHLSKKIKDNNVFLLKSQMNWWPVKGFISFDLSNCLERLALQGSAPKIKILLKTLARHLLVKNVV